MGEWTSVFHEINKIGVYIVLSWEILNTWIQSYCCTNLIDSIENCICMIISMVDVPVVAHESLCQMGTRKTCFFQTLMAPIVDFPNDASPHMKISDLIAESCTIRN